MFVSSEGVNVRTRIIVGKHRHRGTTSEYGTNLVGSVGSTSPTQNGSAFNPIPAVSGFQGGL